MQTLTFSESNEPDGERPAPRADIAFPPVRNGVDYLASVVDHLTRADPPGPRDLKYAVLHLQAAVEVLLKTRLQREHWSLVFKEPGKATRKAFTDGTLDSCTTAAAIDRLREIAGVDIGTKAAESVRFVSRWRNSLQHYGLTVEAYAVENRATQVLDFLTAFAHEELLPALGKDEADTISRELKAVTVRLRQLTSFIEARRKRLEDELHGVRDRTVQCWSCDEFGLVAGEMKADGTIWCRFCHLVWVTPHEAASEYLWNVLGSDLDYAAACPECSEPALVPNGARTRHSRTEHSLCFTCGTIFEGLVECGDCKEFYSPGDDDMGLCHGCLADRFARF